MLATVYHNHETNPSVLALPDMVRFIQSATQKGGESELAKGSVVQRSGNWYAVYRDGGTQKWERAGGSKRTAEKLLAKRMNQINAGTYQEFEKILFEEYSAKWLSDYAKISVKASTYNSYETIVRLHLNPRFGKQFLHRISTSDIQKFVSEKITKEKLTPKSVVNFLVPLKEMFKHAVAWGFIKRDPSLYVKRPRVELEEMDFFTPEEIRLFLDNVNPNHYPLFLTAVMTGMRRGELLALQWVDIDWNSNQISVRRSIYRGEFVNPKSKNSIRRIVITPILRQAFEQHRLLGRKSELGLIFSNENGFPLNPENLIKREFHSALDRAGLRRIRFHDLRHSYASLLISQGENIKFIQSQLGHSSAKTTLDRYGHLMPNLENDAARRLDKTVFGNFVRKLLENPVSEGISPKKGTPEVVELQGLKLGSGGRI
ncbi:MAG TPA: site-specific integrase [Acidobacteriota bacterium]|nr:site-specific integrase [Acidobacteriota bacterium]